MVTTVPPEISMVETTVETSEVVTVAVVGVVTVSVCVVVMLSRVVRVVVVGVATVVATVSVSVAVVLIPHQVHVEEPPKSTSRSSMPDGIWRDTLACGGIALTCPLCMSCG